jgi:hypothetical protein
VSSLSRLRKAVVIRAYNLRKPDETLDDQFRRFAVRDVDGVLYISFDNIKRCLLMETKEYDWVDKFLQHSFGTEVSSRVQCSAAPAYVITVRGVMRCRGQRFVTLTF